MRSGRPAAGAALFLASFLSVDAARAVGRVLGPPDREHDQPALRVAIARSPEQTTVWWSLRVAGPARRIAVVVPALPGTAIDPVSPAWFDALERSTAPRIVLADGTPPTCGGSEGSSVHDTSEAPGGQIAVSEL